ncbi:hypothetical protein QFZ62_001131 [Clavibacter sp. B3I6]|uniref:hypothetical protein n=1 Tax=Clavibacter sp. B3I6 TaxID=3042268 RepID=UPI0027818F54|nr:hypothetical protein [Clavibacter sp. B3I6]MDQ0743823.1 hypothetical protein [Clavibacter sp. B3I6]
MGARDGGPGLPVLGWSTTAGDLRIPHFVGMHALQLLPIAALLLGAAGRRIPALAPDRVRVRLTAIAAAAYLAVVGLVTVQALGGEPVSAPSAGVVTAGAAIAAAALVAGVAAVLLGDRRRDPGAPAVPAGGRTPDQPSAASSLAEISSRSK